MSLNVTLAVLAAVWLLIMVAGIVGITGPWRARRSWRKLAHALGSMRVVSQSGDGIMRGPPMLEGTFREFHVICELYSRPPQTQRMQLLGYRRIPWRSTRVVVACRRPLPPGFKLKRQGLIENLLAQHDIEVGDGGFDDAFVVGGKATGVVRALLADLGVRRTLVELLVREPGMTVDAGRVVVGRKGVVTKHDQLMSMFDVAITAVLTLEHAAAAGGSRA